MSVLTRERTAERDRPVTRRRPARPGSAWTALTAAVAALVILPVVVVAASILTPTVDVWRHLLATRLPRMLSDTLLLLAGVGIGTLVLGAGLAWLVTAYRFPGRRVFGWLLVLPLAVPAYVLGFVFLSVFGFTGPVQGGIRSLFGPAAWVPPVDSLLGAVIVMTLALYPYVYLLARAALREQAAGSYEVARSLGHGRLRAAFRVVLPLARPSLAAGLALTMMETLTDFATVQYFSVETVSVGVFRVWKGMFDRTAASELAALVLVFALAVLLLERVLRGRARYDQEGGASRRIQPEALGGVKRLAATAVCSLVLLVAFVAPVAQLAAWSLSQVMDAPGGMLAPRFLSYLGNSAVLAALAAVGCVTLAVLVTNAARFDGRRLTSWLGQASGVGYAVPGPVVAIGVLLVLAAADGALSATGATAGGWLVTGSLVGLVYAYVVRFLALGTNTVDASLQKVPAEMTMSARVLGARPRRVLARIHLPLVRSGVGVALLLVVVEALKELPVVLLLRPFGFDTLSVWVWQLASDSRWQSAALPALTIVAVALVPVLLLFRRAVSDSEPAPVPVSSTVSPTPETVR